MNLCLEEILLELQGVSSEKVVPEWHDDRQSRVQWCETLDLPLFSGLESSGNDSTHSVRWSLDVSTNPASFDLIFENGRKNDGFEHAAFLPVDVMAKPYM